MRRTASTLTPSRSATAADAPTSAVCGAAPVTRKRSPCSVTAATSAGHLTSPPVLAITSPLCTIAHASSDAFSQYRARYGGRASRTEPLRSRCRGGRSPRIRAADNTSSAVCRRPSRAADTPSWTRVSACASACERSERTPTTSIEATASVTSKPVTIASRPARPGMPSLLRFASQLAKPGMPSFTRFASRPAKPGIAKLHAGWRGSTTRRRRAPKASTIVLAISVKRASSINNEATANAPTRSYSS